ncbi:MAG: Coenzyme F420 hydrogenase/dehydrogenase, beta subunit C-terminal domain [Phototrophicaceae bacterium]
MQKTIKQFIRDKIWHREFSETQINKYVGYYENTYLAHATDQQLRENAASGGAVSALLMYMLEQKLIDGALVLDSVIADGKVRPKFIIAQSVEEIMQAQGSKYSAVYFSQQALPLLQAFDGRLAVVALPCDARILQAYRSKHAEFNEKIKMVIALYCGHNSEPELTDWTIDNLSKSNVQLVDFKYRTGHWRGELEATFDDGSVVKKPFSHFSDYRNVYFFAQKKCHHCCDHFGYFCDISAGDIWSPEMKNNPVKHTSLITRTARGESLVRQAAKDQLIATSSADIKQITNGQARTLPFHYNVSARAQVAPLFGTKIKDITRERVSLLDTILALIAIANERFSNSRFGGWVVKHMPRPILKLYLYLFKGLESI